MKSSLKSDLGLLLLRVTGSGLLLTHGIPKLNKLFAEGPIEFGDPIGIGAGPSLFLTVFAEFLCAVLVLIGFKTRWASIPIIITMAVAALIVHASDPIGVKEKALLFLGIFVSIFLLGPGKYSIDRN